MPVFRYALTVEGTQVSYGKVTLLPVKLVLVKQSYSKVTARSPEPPISQGALGVPGFISICCWWELSKSVLLWGGAGGLGVGLLGVDQGLKISPSSPLHAPPSPQTLLAHLIFLHPFGPQQPHLDTSCLTDLP